MEDILNGAHGLTAPSLVVGGDIGIPEIVPIPYQEIAEKRALNKTWDRLKNQKNVTLRSVVRKTQSIISFHKMPHYVHLD